jgi:hypothetical protein
LKDVRTQPGSKAYYDYKDFLIQIFGNDPDLLVDQRSKRRLDNITEMTHEES